MNQIHIAKFSPKTALAGNKPFIDIVRDVEIKAMPQYKIDILETHESFDDAARKRVSFFEFELKHNRI